MAVIVLAAHAWVIGGGAVRRAGDRHGGRLSRACGSSTSGRLPSTRSAVGASSCSSPNPLDVVNAGFWLTFGASGALLMAAARWQALCGPCRGWHAAVGLCRRQAAVELVLMPVSALRVRACDGGRIGAEPGRGAGDGRGAGSGVACVMADAVGHVLLADAAGWVTLRAARVLVDSSRLVDLAPWVSWRVPPPSLSR